MSKEPQTVTPDSHEVSREIRRKMTPAQKLNALTNLYWTARALKAAGLRMRFPHLDESAISEKVREIFLYAND